jgi:RecB family exonuclease
MKVSDPKAMMDTTPIEGLLSGRAKGMTGVVDSDPSAARLMVAAESAIRVGAAADWLRAKPRDAELLILAPTWEAADDLVRSDATQVGARFGLKRLTLDRLARQLASPELANRRRVPANELSLAAVVARVVHDLQAEGALGHFTPVAKRPGFSRAVTRTLLELRMNAPDGAAMAGLGRESQNLAVLAERVEQELAAAGLADRAVVYEAATAAASGKTPPDPVGIPLLLLDLPVASRREMELLAALARRAPEVLATAARGESKAVARLERVLGCSAQVLHPAPPSTSLAALQAHLFEEKAPPLRVLDETVTLRSAPGEARECVEIARRIQSEAARGVPFDRMAIFLHAPADYTAHLEEAFRRAAIPAFFARSARRPHPAGRALLSLLACAAEQLSARRFAEYLSLAQVPDPADPNAPGAADGAWRPPDDDLLQVSEPPAGEPATSPAAAASGDDLDAEAERDLTLRDPESVAVISGTLRAPWRWEQLLVEAAVIGGKERWARRLAGLERELVLRRKALDDGDETRIALIERDLRDLGHLRQFALPLIERLAALPRQATWGEWLGHLRGLVIAALRHPDPVLATLAELEPMAPVGPVELDEVRLVLAPRLRDLAVPPGRRRYGKVFVAPTAAARGLEFRVVFVPGLAERLFPRKIVEDPILPDAARSTAGELETQPARAAAERMALQLAVGAARERVHLSYPRLDVGQARARMPSFYALEALRAAEGKLPGFEELSARAEAAAGARLGWPAPERPEEAIDEAEYDLTVLAPLMGVDDSAAAGSARYLVSANAHLARALRARAMRWDTRWTVSDGLVKPDELARGALARHQLSARSYSPTALQHFAACPYRFFLQAVHRLAPREEPVSIETIDPLTRGALVHEVQFEVLTLLQADGLLPVRPETLEAAGERLDRILDSAAERYEDRLAPAIKRVWDDGIDSIRADLRDWVRRQAAATDGWEPHRFELSFGLAEHERPHADPASISGAVPVAGQLRLRGSIDLVERRPNGELRVTDHKTGKVRAKEGMVIGGGEVLQPVLYALACEQVLASPVESGRLYYCTADGAFTERIVPLDESSRRAARALAGIIDHWLSQGFLPAAPRKDGCRYCDYLPVCGPYEELRVSRKPRERLAELLTLREMR